MMAVSKSVRVRQLAWYGDTEVELGFPDSWEVVPYLMKGYEAAPISADALKRAFANPIGTPTIRELARGKKEVVIIFDDMTRPTNVAELVPYVLKELEEAGIPDSNIRFIPGLGAHGALNRMEMVQKLGEATVERFPVYNHNPYDNCTDLGKTSRGTPVSINSEVMACDLKIAIGAIVPHWSAGFGGGAKLVVPGVASMETIWANHHDVGGRDKPTKGSPLGKLHHTVGLGKAEGNVIRLDMEEICRMVGLDVIVNVLVNGKRESVAAYVGDVVAAHREGLKMAQAHYATPFADDADISITNAYSKASEAMIAFRFGASYVKKNGGALVLIANTPSGQVTHYLSGAFGKALGGKLWGKRQLPENVKKFIVLTSYIDRGAGAWLGPAEDIIWAKTWEEVLSELRRDYPGHAKVAVIPDGTIQYCPSQ
ncbi:MAG: lactate racemase domain-containing protein [Chloroflexota bacterium]